MNKVNSCIKIGKNFRSILLMCFLIIILCGTIYANMYTQGSIHVNKEELPSLDTMKIINSNITETSANDIFDKQNINVVDGKIRNKFGISLLSSKLASDNPYIIEKIDTNNIDCAMLTFENYIIGDTSDFHYNQEEDFYTYKEGEKFFSPLSLEVDIILSEEQMNKGLDVDYLGDYKFEEQYVSKQGYKVNIISSGTKENSEKCAIFVADGIRYTLKGRTGLANMKAVVDTMEYAE